MAKRWFCQARRFGAERALSDKSCVRIDQIWQTPSTSKTAHTALVLATLNEFDQLWNNKNVSSKWLFFEIFYLQSASFRLIWASQPV